MRNSTPAKKGNMIAMVEHPRVQMVHGRWALSPAHSPDSSQLVKASKRPAEILFVSVDSRVPRDPFRRRVAHSPTTQSERPPPLHEH